MSTERDAVPEDGASKEIHVTQFFGGNDRGLCLQLTQTVPDHFEYNTQYIQITQQQAGDLCGELQQWLVSDNSRHFDKCSDIQEEPGPYGGLSLAPFDIDMLRKALIERDELFVIVENEGLEFVRMDPNVEPWVCSTLRKLADYQDAAELQALEGLIQGKSDELEKLKARHREILNR